MTRHGLSDLERFFPKIDFSGECWIWTAALNQKGYGEFHTPTSGPFRMMVRAHRFSYSTFVGPIPAGDCVLHKCDVRNCVNPEHLFLGSRADNNADMVAKGRHRPGRKLTEAQVLEIRASKASHETLGGTYNVTPENIRAVRARKTWKYI